MKIMLGISGASGVSLGLCLLENLAKFSTKQDEIFCVISKGARLSFEAERRALGENLNESLNSNLDKNLNLNKSSNLKATSSPAFQKNSKFLSPSLDVIISEAKFKNIRFFDDENLAAPLASGSFGITHTIIAPCSLTSLAKVANGIADTLISRAAAVALKEQKKLILAVREMPLSSIALEQMARLSKIGVCIAPPVYASYGGIESLQDLEGFFVGKWLDLLEIKHNLYKKWS